MQHHAEILAILPLAAFAGVRLTGIDKQPVSGAQHISLAVDGVAHPARVYADEFKIIMPMAAHTAVGIIGKPRPASKTP